MVSRSVDIGVPSVCLNISNRHHRQRCSVAEATGALVSRRIKAKQLLMEIQERLGKNALNTVIELIQDYKENPLDAKAQLVAVLGKDEDLQKRTWAFFSSAP